MKAAHSEYINGESFWENKAVNLSFCHILIKQAGFDCNKSLYYSQAFIIRGKKYAILLNHCWNTDYLQNKYEVCYIIQKWYWQLRLRAESLSGDLML